MPLRMYVICSECSQLIDLDDAVSLRERPRLQIWFATTLKTPRAG
jgi:hypothetical protein